MAEREGTPNDPTDGPTAVGGDSAELARVQEEESSASEAHGHELEVRAAAELDRPREQPPPSRYAPRFQFFFGVLLALGIVGIGAFVAVALKPKAGPPAPWSQWRPSDRGPSGAQQVADHVGGAYRLPDGHQLVTVRPSDPLKIQNIDTSIVLKSSDPTTSDTQVPGNSLMYTLCGDTVNCGIHGVPSFARALLLRREALELALYSFRYLDNADNVVVILPPKPAVGKQSPPAPTSGMVVFLRRDDVGAMLNRPLNVTLANQTPTLTNLNHFPDLETVVAVTGQRLYQFGLAQAQDLSVLLELTKLNA